MTGAGGVGERAGRPEDGELREALAAEAHEAWSGWMRYLFDRCIIDPTTGDWMIPMALVDRWQRQMHTPYSGLPDNEQESDRQEADRYLALVRAKAAGE